MSGAPRYLKTVSKSTSARPDIAVAATVSEMLAAIRQDGDDAVRRFSQDLDGWAPAEGFRLSPARVEEIVAEVPAGVLRDIRTAQQNVRAFAEQQLSSLHDFEVESQPGVMLGQKSVPVGAVGAYVPGGRYPLVASAHMTVVTAKVAGVPRVVACTPPIRGQVPAASVAAMHLAGADEIHLLGGVQAIGAMGLGTDTIDRVDLLVGPGNAYVAEAKRQLFGEVGIDLFAGPTEILIIGDERADPLVVAVDLLSQAEHGPDSPAIFITTSADMGKEVLALIDRLLPDLPTADLAGVAWRDHGEIAVVDDLDEAYRLADTYAAEHVEILIEQPRRALEAMTNYGALFLGERTCVAYGDKVIGTNHTLPTRGAARYTGGLWVGKFLRTITYQEVVDDGASAALGELCGRAARLERFEGHARAADLRVAKFGDATLDWYSGEIAQSRA